MNPIEYTDYIMHWGIKGQKWGVRRFQNEDGTLTPAGKERYSNKEQKELYKEIKNKMPGHIDANSISSDSFKDARNIMKSQKDEINKTNSDINNAANKMFSDIHKKINTDKKFKEEIITEALEEAKRYGSLIGDEYELEMYVNDTLPERLYEKYKTKESSDLESKYRSQVKAYYDNSRDMSESLLGKYGDKSIGKFNDSELAVNVVQDLLASGERWGKSHTYKWDPEHDKLGMHDPNMNWDSYNKITKSVYPEVSKRLGLKTHPKTKSAILSQLKSDFGSYKQVDDFEFLNLVAYEYASDALGPNSGESAISNYADKIIEEFKKSS